MRGDERTIPPFEWSLNDRHEKEPRVKGSMDGVGFSGKSQGEKETMGSLESESDLMHARRGRKEKKEEERRELDARKKRKKREPSIDSSH